MTPAETARVLAKCAAYDQRTVGESDVMAWHEALADVDYTDALEAVTRHHRMSVERIKPADVRDRARDVRLDRRRLDRRRNPALALPSRYESDADRAERIARGVAACRDAIAAPDDDPEAETP